MHLDSRLRARLYLEEYRSGLTLEQVGARHGVTRERVRQLIEAIAPGLIAETFAGRQAARSAATAARRQAAADARPLYECRVCGRSFKIPYRSVTCSPTCEAAWKAARPLFDPEVYRRSQIYQARHHLRHPDRTSQAMVESSRRLLAHYEATGEVLAPNRRFVIPGSARWQKVVAAVGEERARELLDAVTAAR